MLRSNHFLDIETIHFKERERSYYRSYFPNVSLGGYGNAYIYIGFSPLKTCARTYVLVYYYIHIIFKAEN